MILRDGFLHTEFRISNIILRILIFEKNEKFQIEFGIIALLRSRMPQLASQHIIVFRSNGVWIAGAGTERCVSVIMHIFAIDFLSSLKALPGN